MAVRGGFGRSLFDLISFIAFLGFRGAIRLLPWSSAYTLGDILALGWWALDAPHRRLALANLEIAFPEFGSGKRRRLAFRCFRHLGWVLVETLRYGRLNARNWRDRTALEGSRNFECAVARGKGVIAISAHLGNWEWLSAHGFRFGRVHVIARAIHNPYINTEIRRRREKAGMHQIYPTRESSREILKILRGGETACFLVDQSAKGEEGVDVPFFGRNAPTHSGPALIALRSRAAVLTVFTLRGKDRRIHLIYGKEIDLIRTGDLRKDVKENTALFTRKVEEMIRLHPEQWFWVHDRWRIRKRRVLFHGP